MTRRSATRQKPRHQSRIGFTLIELMVGMAIGLFLTAAAFTFVSHQTTLLEHTKMRMDMDRSARLALDMLAQDLRHAGAGVGYAPDESFLGLAMGNFVVPGGGNFSANNRQISLEYGQNTGNLSGTYQTVTDDIGIQFANGDYRTILEQTTVAGKICGPADIEAGDIVLFTARGGDTTMSARIDSIGVAPCTSGDCVGGCLAFNWSTDPTFRSDPSADAASYVLGELAGNFQQAVWFVSAANGRGELRRAQVSQAEPCSAPDGNCGRLIAYDVESIQARYWQWDTATGAWADRTTLGSIDDRRRIRVDVELIARVRSSEKAERDGIASELEPGECFPGPCGSRDQINREVLRTSVEVRNSGRMSKAILAN